MTRDELMDILRVYTQQGNKETMFCFIGNQEDFALGVHGATPIMINMLGSRASEDEDILRILKAALELAEGK